MDTTYKPARTTPTPEEHADAKEVNDLVNAIVDRDASIAKEAVEAVIALMGELGDAEARFIHLYKVLDAVVDNQLQARFLEKDTTA